METKVRAGILGGGQLSMMLVQRAQLMGLHPKHLTASLTDPASLVSPNSVLGDPKNETQLKSFIQELNVLTFESEFYDAAYLKKHLANFKGQIFPNLDCLQLLQDRNTQKTALVNSKLETSPFIQTSHKTEIKAFFKKMGSLVAKKRWNGYDGYGTFILRDEKQLEDFLSNSDHDLEHFIFEKLIKFEYEAAVQVARSKSGHVVFFPFVKTTQKDNKCFLVEGPEKETAEMKRLKKLIQKFLSKIDYVGVIGFEFFKTKSGLIINEVAPRVHNTGHHTLDSCTVDQFTMHLLCALQDKLPAVELKSKAFVMLNLIGTSTHEVQIPDRRQGNLFWYGKSNREGRKLGHINFTGENKKALVYKAFQELKIWKL